MERRQRAEDKADYEGVRRGWFLGERSVYLWKEMDRIHKMNRIPKEQNEVGWIGQTVGPATIPMSPGRARVGSSSSDYLPGRWWSVDSPPHRRCSRSISARMCGKELYIN